MPISILLKSFNSERWTESSHSEPKVTRSMAENSRRFKRINSVGFGGVVPVSRLLRGMRSRMQ